ncbi:MULTISPECIES: hypothetical protein [Actinoalloteichus]|uniref:Uncharacterized protein n=1 Tax=Actinoalloteichus fjordicus TaxID=1612552 RepID=A0AAC9L7A7_9PSEU|nr:MULTISPECIES: hypothetical protein [Actinoalloteichus]APU12523.1 hypothetical protein UA74_02180 [Actinoalloteichus fjordicus]APU18477.1 hypothetical protein UA75_02190 [Actinoalloteichus sp. GBA129-24]
MRARSRALAGAADWQALVSAGATVCPVLADVAEELCRLRNRFVRDVQGVVRRALRDRPEVVRRAVASLAEKYADHQLGNLRDVALALRVIGVYLCVVEARLDRCRCVRPMVREAAPDAVKAKLNEALPALPTP